jgi:hypothetical protein
MWHQPSILRIQTTSPQRSGKRSKAQKRKQEQLC